MTEPQCFSWLICQMHPDWKLVFTDDGGDITFEADEDA